MGHVSIRRMRRIQTSDLFLPLHNEVVALLRGLDKPDWSRPTVAKQWVVKDVVAHLLDTDLRRLSSMRDGYMPASRSGNIVAWAGEERSANWMDVGRKYTEKC